eukprot:1055477-Rhodomonas_salina.1
MKEAERTCHPPPALPRTHVSVPRAHVRASEGAASVFQGRLVCAIMCLWRGGCWARRAARG